MSGFVHFLKTIFIPLVFSGILYISITYLILPFVRRNRHRYNQYIPMPTSFDSISDGTTSFRNRLADALYALFMPTSWARRRRTIVDGSGAEHHEDELFDDEEGEGMVGFDIDERRREALEQRRSTVGDEDRRLSRDLEEGFKDDSDDEDAAQDPQRITMR